MKKGEFHAKFINLNAEQLNLTVSKRRTCNLNYFSISTCRQFGFPLRFVTTVIFFGSFAKLNANFPRRRPFGKNDAFCTSERFRCRCFSLCWQQWICTCVCVFESLGREALNINFVCSEKNGKCAKRKLLLKLRVFR